MVVMKTHLLLEMQLNVEKKSIRMAYRVIEKIEKDLVSLLQSLEKLLGLPQYSKINFKDSLMNLSPQDMLLKVLADTHIEKM